MTRAHNARLAGFSFLFYIAAGICGFAAFSVATRGSTAAARLESIAAHPASLALSFICSLLTILCAIILAVTLYALARDQDADLARLAMMCRLLEAAINVFPAIALLALMNLATTSGEAGQNAVVDLLLKVQSWSTPTAAAIFAIGSAVYCALFLRGGLIPAWLARLGLIASVLLVVVEPLEAVGLTNRFVAGVVWLPMLAFEVPFGVWLLIIGAKMPRVRSD